MTDRRVALVTGAARGIGAASVAALVAQGYAVVAVDSCAGEGPTRPDAVTYPLATREQLDAVGAAGGDAVLTRVADVRDKAAMQAAARLAVDELGRLDAVVAAAAVMAGGAPLWQTPDDELEALWQVDVRGVWTTAAVTVPLMLAGPAPSGCRFVALASAAGAHGLFRLAAYSAAKHAVVGLVKGLAADLVGTGVTAVAVSPGSTRTDMLTATAALYGESDVEGFAASTLVRRLLEPDEIAATVAFCCSVAGGVLNGSVVQADGGFTP